MYKLNNWLSFVCTASFFLSTFATAQDGTRMADSIFREYDIRGIVGQEIHISAVYDFGRAIATYLLKKNPNITTLALGMDGRIHSLAIKQELTKALIDSGINVLFLGVCTTPSVYFSLHNLPVDGGVMITASHNPKEYNGFKICLGKESIAGDQIREFKDVYTSGIRIAASTKGTYTDQPIHDLYIGWLVEHFAHLKNIDVPIVIDCGNGAAGTMIPRLIKELGWQNVRIIYEEVDGNYPHHEADPTVEKNMADLRQILLQGSYSFGIGFDGDVDRMAAMTNNGYLVTGDRLLTLYSGPILKNHPGASIICDISSSSILLNILESWGAHPRMVQTGHTNIKHAIKEHHAMLGGELSCHFFFADRYFGYDDGIYAALRLVELIHESKKSLTDMLSVFPTTFSTPVIRIPCEPTISTAIVSAVRQYALKNPQILCTTIDGVRLDLPEGWFLVRASNTQPVLCVRCEASSSEELLRLKHEVLGLLKPYFDQKQLVTYLNI